MDDAAATPKPQELSLFAGPPVVFLGFAERVSLVRDLGTEVPKWDILGLKNVLLANFFPCTLGGYNIALAIYRVHELPGVRLRVVDDLGSEIGSFTLGFSRAISADNEQAVPNTGKTRIHGFVGGWTVAFIPVNIEAPGPILLRPGQYTILAQVGDRTEEIAGNFYSAIVEPAPLTPDRIAAIKADPHAAKAVRADFGCKECPSTVKVYAALERSPKLEAEGYRWYQDIPNRFECQCKRTAFDMASVRRNFFAPIGAPLRPTNTNVSFQPLYERGALENLQREFIDLLATTSKEEDIQKFIERNPIVLHQFPAERVFFKPGLLTHLKADFGIVTPQKELILIEIERANMRLLRKDGDHSAHLTHAFNQVHNWLHVADEHRQAVLDDLRVPKELVSRVLGVVIAGRDLGNDAEHLRRLKGTDHGRVRLLTYDDLVLGLGTLARDLNTL